MEQVRIKPGAVIHLDFRCWRWPDAPNGDASLIFDAVPASFDENYLELTAEKFGRKGAYGNGSIYVRRDGVQADAAPAHVGQEE